MMWNNGQVTSEYALYVCVENSILGSLISLMNK